MRELGLLAVLLAFFALPAPASAQWGRPGDGGVQTLDQILPGIRTDHPGRFYDAEGPFPDAMGGMHYRIKWLTPEGRVIWLDTDARTGRVIGPWAAHGAEGFGPGRGGPPMERRFTPGGWGRGFGRGWPGRGRWPRG
jgi:hypothetical protein